VLDVKDVEASTKFYTDMLRFEISAQRPIAEFLTCGEIHHDPDLFQATEGVLPVTVGRFRGPDFFAGQFLQAIT